MKRRTVPPGWVLWGGLAAVAASVAVWAQDIATTQPQVPPTPPAAMAEGKVTAAISAVETAQGAMDGGDSRAALEALDEARTLMAEAQDLLVAARFANTRCPITGIAIDPANVMESETRMYKGQVVAFSSSQNVIGWDKLSDPEKDSKLAGATGAIPRSEVGSRVINLVCPVDGRRIDPVLIRASTIRLFRGQPVGFCGFRDRRKWDRMDDAQRAALLAKALAGPVAKVDNTLCPIDGGRIDPVSIDDRFIREYRGYRIGFCRYSCGRQWDHRTPAERDAALRAVLPPVGAGLPPAPPMPEPRYGY